jgi:hypothetical protein
MEKTNEKLTKRDLKRYEVLKKQLEEMSRQLRQIETKKQRAERKRINHAIYIYAGWLIANMKQETVIGHLEKLKIEVKRESDKEDIQLLINKVKKEKQENKNE